MLNFPKKQLFLPHKQCSHILLYCLHLHKIVLCLATNIPLHAGILTFLVTNDIMPKCTAFNGPENTGEKNPVPIFLFLFPSFMLIHTSYQRAIYLFNVFWHSCFSGITNQQKAHFIVMAVIMLNSIVTIII